MNIFRLLGAYPLQHVSIAKYWQVGSRFLPSLLNLHSSTEDEVFKCISPLTTIFAHCWRNHRVARGYRSNRRCYIWWCFLLAISVSSVLSRDSPYFNKSANMKLGWPDLFWTFTDSLYNTTFKILFIGSSAYIIYLMLNDYKPTHDPNLDTFKVQYLLGFSVLFALLFSHVYKISEVSMLELVICAVHWRFQDSLDVLNLAWVRCHPTPAFYAAANRGSRYYNHSLSFCFGCIPCTLHPELAISLFCGEPFWGEFRHGRNCPNAAIFGLLLYILYQVSLMKSIFECPLLT